MPASATQNSEVQQSPRLTAAASRANAAEEAFAPPLHAINGLLSFCPFLSVGEMVLPPSKGRGLMFPGHCSFSATSLPAGTTQTFTR